MRLSVLPFAAVLSAGCSEFNLFGRGHADRGTGADSGADTGACGEAVDAPYVVLHDDDYISVVGSAGDVDHDGRDDLWIYSRDVDWEGSEVPLVVVPGLGNGPVFGEDVATWWLEEPSVLSERFDATALPDLNRDGLPELAVAADPAEGSDYWRVLVLFGGKQGAVTASDAESSLLSSERLGYTLDASADLTGDGARDLVITTGGSDVDVGVWVVGEIPPGQQFVEGLYDAVFHDTDGLGSGFEVAAGDLDGDGVGDLVVSEVGVGGVAVYDGPLHGSLDLNDAAAVLSVADSEDLSPLLTVGGTGDPPPAAGGDGDGDGTADLAVSATAGPSVGLWLVAGIPEDAVVQEAAYASFSDPDVTVFGGDVRWLGDVDRDGWDDLAVHLGTGTGVCGGTETIFFGPFAGVVDRTRSRSFRSSYPVDDPAHGQVWASRIGDVDGDGLDDLAFRGWEPIDAQAGVGSATYVVPLADL